MKREDRADGRWEDIEGKMCRKSVLSVNQEY